MKVVTLAIGLVLAGLILVCVSSQARADVIDPQIFVCTGCTKSPGGDPNTIDPASINIGFDAAHTSAVSPLLVIVGVPNGGTAPTISLPTGVNAASGQRYYGLLTATSGTTAANAATTFSSGEAYSTLGLSGGNNSNGFTNWSATNLPNGAPNPDAGVSSFSLYTYAVDYALGTTANPSPINVDLTGGTTFGDWVIAYTCSTAATPPAACTGDVGSTPITNAGLVPEPSTLLLFGTGLLGIVGARRRLF